MCCVNPITKNTIKKRIKTMLVESNMKIVSTKDENEKMKIK
jgi:hypothetical protein